MKQGKAEEEKLTYAGLKLHALIIVLIFASLSIMGMGYIHSSINIERYRFPPDVQRLVQETAPDTDLSVVYGVILLLPLGAVVCYILGPEFIKYERKLKPLDGKNPRLLALVKKLSDKVGLKKNPEVFFSDESYPDCFAFGRSRRDAGIAVTKGFVEGLSSREIRAVILHELGHIRHGDMVLKTWAILYSIFAMGWFIMMLMLGLIMVGMEIMVGGFIPRTGLFAEVAPTNPPAIFASFAFHMLVLFIFFILIPHLFLCSFSKSREHLADAWASLAGKKKNLISALRSVARIYKTRARYVSRGIQAPKFSGIARKIRAGGILGFIGNLFDPLPSPSERVRALASGDFISTAKKTTALLKTSMLVGIISFYVGLLFGGLLVLTYEPSNVPMELPSYLSYQTSSATSLIFLTAPATIILLNLVASWTTPAEPSKTFRLLLIRNLVSIGTFLLLLSILLATGLLFTSFGK